MLEVRAAAAAAAAAAEADPPLFLNDMGEVGDESGGGGSAVKELVIVAICCSGFPVPLFEVKGIRGGGGRFEPDAADFGVDGGETAPSDLLSLSSSFSIKLLLELRSCGDSTSL